MANGFIQSIHVIKIENNICCTLFNLNYFFGDELNVTNYEYTSIQGTACSSPWVFTNESVPHLECSRMSLFLTLSVHQWVCSSPWVFTNKSVPHLECSRMSLFLTLSVHEWVCSSPWVFTNESVPHPDCWRTSVFLTLPVHGTTWSSPWGFREQSAMSSMRADDRISLHTFTWDRWH